MNKTRLTDMSYGEFQDKLVQLAMKEIDNKATTPLLYFPLVLERVESFLLVHWSMVWEKCAQMDWDEWLTSHCHTLFQGEVILDIQKEVSRLEESKSKVV